MHQQALVLNGITISCRSEILVHEIQCIQVLFLYNFFEHIVMTLWQCDHCGLGNYMNRMYCQACFRIDNTFKQDIDCVDYISELLKYLDGITLVNLYLSKLFDALSYDFMSNYVKAASISNDLEYEAIIKKYDIKNIKIGYFSNAIDIKRHVVKYCIYNGQPTPDLNINYRSFNEEHDFEWCGFLYFRQSNYFPVHRMYCPPLAMSDDDLKLLLWKLFSKDEFPLNSLKTLTLYYNYDPWGGQAFSYDHTWFHHVYFIRNNDFSRCVMVSELVY